jgi:ribonuclease HI
VSRQEEKWQAPPVGKWKANWDAALNLKEGRTRLGVVVRDHEGRLRAAQCYFRMGVVDPVVTETMATVNALHFCLDQSVTNICIKGDAKNVVDALRSKTANWSKFNHVVANAKLLCNRFDAWEINHMG